MLKKYFKKRYTSRRNSDGIFSVARANIIEKEA